MGYSAYSYAVFGLKVSKNDITKETQVRNCNHNVDLQAKFCSECGKPIYQIKKERIVDHGYSPNEIGYFVSDPGNDNTGILGFVLAKTDYNSTTYLKIPLPTLEMIEQLKEFLHEHSIEYNEEELNSYLYTYHSY